MNVIKKGCEMLGWDQTELFEKCIKAIEINKKIQRMKLKRYTKRYKELYLFA